MEYCNTNYTYYYYIKKYVLFVNYVLRIHINYFLSLKMLGYFRLGLLRIEPFIVIN